MMKRRQEDMKILTYKLIQQTEKYVRKFLAQCSTQLADDVFLKILKDFEVMLNNIEISRV